LRNAGRKGGRSRGRAVETVEEFRPIEGRKPEPPP
jgi:hypothetical protein